MIKKILLLALVFTTASVFAQDGGNTNYSNGLGLRGGNYFGLSYKFAKNSNFVEAILTDYGKGLQVAAFYEIQGSTGLGKLDWYYGPGVHFGFSDDYIALGVDGVVGLEVQVFDLPFTVGLDAIPRLTLIEDTDFDIQLGAHIRYIW
tara:strand:- start:409476 stop:409916 length:441 start_codon:yes stop_codon:yes gene_type:complete